MPLNCRFDRVGFGYLKNKNNRGDVGILSRGREAGHISATWMGGGLFWGYVGGSMGQLRRVLDEE